MILTTFLLVVSIQAPAQVQAHSPILGFGHCTPTLFISPVPNTTVVTRDITYVPGGSLAGYTQEIKDPSGKITVAKIMVNRAKWTGLCTSLSYSVEIAGKQFDSPTVEAFDKSATENVIGFTAEELGGAVVLTNAQALGQGGFKTQFSYDEKGRRTISRQTFALGTTRYEIIYSSYTYDDLGGLQSYVAEIKTQK